MFHVDFMSELEEIFKSAADLDLTDAERLAVDNRVAKTFFT